MPYLVIPGNQERFDSGQFFDYRFKMPNANEEDEDHTNNYYYFKQGEAHFTLINFDYAMNSGSKVEKEIFEWFYQTLEDSRNSGDLRWRFVMANRPILCGNVFPVNDLENSKYSSRDCQANYFLLNKYLDAMKKFGIDVFFSGNEPYYERLKLMNNFEIQTDVKSREKGNKVILYNLVYP